MMPLHVAAQSVAWFVILVFVGIALVLWRDVRSESRAEKERIRKDVRTR